MARTQVRSAQLEDEGITRADLNVSTSGLAVVRKVIQGTGIAISATGADAGTGDATITLSLDAYSSTHGAVLYRGSSAWVALAPGTAGQVLQSNGSGANPSWVNMNTALIDTGNSSTSTLTSGSTFTGTGLSTLGYGSVSLSVFASHDSAADGLAVEQSTDNSNWDIADYMTVKSGQAVSLTVNFDAEFYRVVYVNGGTNQTTFRIEARLNPTREALPDGNRSNAPSISTVTTLTTTSDVDLVAAPGSNKSILLRMAKSYNSSATLSRVDLKDNTTVFAYLAAAASGGGEVYRPWRKLLGENNALKGALSVSVTDVRISTEHVVVKS